MYLEEFLIKSIKKAFSNRVYPGDANISDYFCSDKLDSYDIDDPSPLIGKKWEDLTPDFFWGENWENISLPERNCCAISALSFLSGQGFRYFLPAYLIMTIRYYYDFNITLTLTFSSKDLQNWKLERYNGFTFNEIQVIVNFLEFIASNYSGSHEKNRIFNSLSEYWYPRLETLIEK